MNPGVALASLPVLRRGLFAAGNPMSAVFWESTERILTELDAGTARTGDVRAWLEATATEPTSMIGLHVWDEPPDRSRLQAELHARLVRHLEEKLAAGELDPDGLAAGEAEAQLAWSRIQEQWMNSPLPDGRVPMDTLLDEQDAEFLAEWAEADAEALSALQVVLDEVGDRPLPVGELTAACAAARSAITGDDLTGRLLAACGGAGRPDAAGPGHRAVAHARRRGGIPGRRHRRGRGVGGDQRAVRAGARGLAGHDGSAGPRRSGHPGRTG